MRHTAEDHAERASKHLDNKEYDQAIEEANEAIRLDPTLVEAYLHRAEAYEKKKVYDKAAADYREAIRLEPDSADAHNSLAWLLATCPKDDIRNGAQAIEHAKKACELDDDAIHWDTLAAAYAEAGQFKEAMEWVEKALADEEFMKDHGKEAKKRLNLYRQRKPFRDVNP